MLGSNVSRTRAGRPRPLVLRLLALALVAVQLVPAAGVHAEEPPAPTAHAAHLGAPSDAGCEPVHDHAHCMVCRVLSTHVAGSSALAAPECPAIEADLPLPDLARIAAPGDVATLLNARAPPVS